MRAEVRLYLGSKSIKFIINFLAIEINAIGDVE